MRSISKGGLNYDQRQREQAQRNKQNRYADRLAANKEALPVARAHRRRGESLKNAATAACKLHPAASMNDLVRELKIDEELKAGGG